MLFGVRLANEAYPPWKDQYIAYEKLKKLLKENVITEQGAPELTWTESDESRFVEALDTELEKVYSFVHKKYEELSNRIGAVESTAETKGGDLKVQDTEHELEDILENATQLHSFCRLNYAGFVKIVKKHDRVRSEYQVRPLLNVRLSALPFHNEDYSPLLYRLSNLYTFLTENFAESSRINSASARLSSYGESQGYITFKFWVHPDNVMEVKTRVLRHLPVLVYGTEDGDEDEQYSDPTMTTLYLDNSNFELYDAQLDRQTRDDSMPSLRLKWYGRLDGHSDVTIERRDEVGSVRFKEKYIGGVLRNDQAPVEKQIHRMQERGLSQSAIESYKSRINEYQQYIQDHKLSPVMRTTYTRTAFQIPGNAAVRVILDSDITFIREDPGVRDADNWHRPDLDIAGIENPLSTLRKAEYSKFPYSVLELRLQVKSGADSNSVNSVAKRLRGTGWVEELMASHLVKEVPNFSKYIHGVAVLFGEDEHLHSLPFWLSELDNDILQDPAEVYKQQKERILRQKREIGRRASLVPYSPAQQPVQESTSSPQLLQTEEPDQYGDDDSTDGEGSSSDDALGNKRKGRLGFPHWSNRGPRIVEEEEEEVEEVVLPAGVKKPAKLLRLSGPVKVETKVWLANERTFNRWLSVTVLLSAMTFALYNSLERSSSADVAEKIAYILFGLTLFSGLWGYYIYLQRLKYISERSERHLDAPFGPVVIGITLLAALSLDFWATLRANLRRNQEIGIHSYF